jgi:hypothetical protein
LSDLKYGIVTVCARLVKACARPDNAMYLSEILWPLAQTLSMSIAMDESNVALLEYRDLARAHFDIATWLNVLTRKRGADWFVPVPIPDPTVSDTSLYLAIFQHTVAEEKALLCSTKQDYVAHGAEMVEMEERIKDRWESVEYVREFTEYYPRKEINQIFKKPVEAVNNVENVNLVEDDRKKNRP